MPKEKYLGKRWLYINRRPVFARIGQWPSGNGQRSFTLTGQVLRRRARVRFPGPSSLLTALSRDLSPLCEKRADILKPYVLK